MSEITIYEDPDAPNPVQVTLEGDTVWLTQAQMAELFGRERSVITKHVRNVFWDGELNQEAVRAFFAHTAADGKTYQTEYYNLDVIISAGYRVKSSRGVRFRQWATSVLKDHLLRGYSLNRHHLAERGVEEAQAVVALISGYAKTWRLLLQYDEDSLALPEGCQPARGVLNYDRALAAIAGLKADLAGRGEATSLFG